MPFQKGHKINSGKKPWNTGKKRPRFSKEWREKMSLAKKGKQPINKVGGWNKGKTGCYKLSDETKNKISEKNKGRKQTLKTRIKKSIALKKAHKEGRHGSYKGGVSKINNKIRHSLEYKIWRTAVFERDNYTCVWCGLKGNKLNADHIKPFSLFPELRFAIDNGRTLCEDCHKTTDTYGSKLLNKKK